MAAQGGANPAHEADFGQHRVGDQTGRIVRASARGPHRSHRDHSILMEPGFAEHGPVLHRAGQRWGRLARCAVADRPARCLRFQSPQDRLGLEAPRQRDRQICRMEPALMKGRYTTSREQGQRDVIVVKQIVIDVA